MFEEDLHKIHEFVKPAAGRREHETQHEPRGEREDRDRAPERPLLHAGDAAAVLHRAHRNWQEWSLDLHTTRAVLRLTLRFRDARLRARVVVAGM